MATRTDRCGWARSDLMIGYHDREWGVPSHDERHVFEHLVLEGAQAGLSWELILRRREGYRRAFAGFDVDAVAEFDDDKMELLLSDDSIIRNRQKIRSAINNACAAQRLRESDGGLPAFLWSLAGNKTLRNGWANLSEIPARSSLSERASRELMARGFTFVGPVGLYSLMQAVGIINDHVVGCFRYSQVG